MHDEDYDNEMHCDGDCDNCDTCDGCCNGCPCTECSDERKKAMKRGRFQW